MIYQNVCRDFCRVFWGWLENRSFGAGKCVKWHFFCVLAYGLSLCAVFWNDLIFWRPGIASDALFAAQAASHRQDIVAVCQPCSEQQSSHLDHKVGHRLLMQSHLLAQVLDQEIDTVLQQVNLGAHPRQCR